MGIGTAKLANGQTIAFVTPQRSFADSQVPAVRRGRRQGGLRAAGALQLAFAVHAAERSAVDAVPGRGRFDADVGGHCHRSATAAMSISGRKRSGCGARPSTTRARICNSSTKSALTVRRTRAPGIRTKKSTCARVPDPTARSGAGGRSDARDVEGVTLYEADDEEGYVIVSSQGNNEYVVYDREDNDYVGKFRSWMAWSSGTQRPTASGQQRRLRRAVRRRFVHCHGWRQHPGHPGSGRRDR